MEYPVLEIVGLNPRTGQKTGDFGSRRSGHEGRGTRKTATPGGREKYAYFLERNSGKIGRGKLSDFL